MGRTCYQKLPDGTRCGRDCNGSSSMCPPHKRAYNNVRNRKRKTKGIKRKVYVPKTVTPNNAFQKTRLQKDMLRVCPCDIASELEIMCESVNFKREWPPDLRDELYDCIDRLTGAPFADPPKKQPTRSDIKTVVGSLVVMRSGEWLKPNCRRVLNIAVERLSEL